MNLVFDIGYNVGAFTDACLQKNPQCKVVGVDANSHLCLNSKHQGSKNIRIVNALVSDLDDDKKDFWVDPVNIGISTASKKWIEDSRFSKGSKYLQKNTGQWVHIGQVKTITLDKMINFFGAPDLVKVDVEGYEHKVFSGLSKKVSKVCFECVEEDKDSLYKIINHLLNLGYEKFGLIGYFEEGPEFEKLTYSENDDHLVEPENYYLWKDLEKELNECFIEDRRINHGMLWAK